jgi:hypothetical protein
MRGTNHDLGALRWNGGLPTLWVHISLVLPVILQLLRMVVIPISPIELMDDVRIGNPRLVKDIGQCVY